MNLAKSIMSNEQTHSLDIAMTMRPGFLQIQSTCARRPHRTCGQEMPSNHLTIVSMAAQSFSTLSLLHSRFLLTIVRRSFLRSVLKISIFEPFVLPPNRVYSVPPSYPQLGVWSSVSSSQNLPMSIVVGVHCLG